MFSDENDNVYRDDVYKNAHKEYYLREIREDIVWYGSVYSVISNKYHINNEPPDVVVEGLINKFHL